MLTVSRIPTTAVILCAGLISCQCIVGIVACLIYVEPAADNTSIHCSFIWQLFSAATVK